MGSGVEKSAVGGLQRGSNWFLWQLRNNHIPKRKKCNLQRRRRNKKWATRTFKIEKKN
jgi:hypothetical protein